MPIERFFELTTISHTSDFTNNNENNEALTESPKYYSFPVNPKIASLNLNKLTPNELEMLFYYQQLDVQDKQDILEFMKMKYRRYKRKK